MGKYKVGDRLVRIKKGNRPEWVGTIITITSVKYDDYYTDHIFGWLTEKYLDTNYIKITDKNEKIIKVLYG